MVKFARQLELSLIPEWKDAYVNYKALKRDVQRVKENRAQRNIHRCNESMAGTGAISRTLTRMSTFKHNVENQVKGKGASGRLSFRHGGAEPLRPEDFLVPDSVRHIAYIHIDN